MAYSKQEKAVLIIDTYIERLTHSASCIGDVYGIWFAAETSLYTVGLSIVFLATQIWLATRTNVSLIEIVLIELLLCGLLFYLFRRLFNKIKATTKDIENLQKCLIQLCNIKRDIVLQDKDVDLKQIVLRCQKLLKDHLTENGKSIV